jgi:signal transduction histidine kinase
MLIVKNVVEAHQGVISVESTEGVGTKITLQLPVQP